MAKNHDRPYAQALKAVSAQAGAVARAAAKSGEDLSTVAQNFLIEVMNGVRGMEDRELAMIGHAAESFVKSALEERLDPGAAAKGLVEGAGAWAREWGRGAGIATAVAEQGAIDAADRSSPEAGRYVREALKGRTPGEPFVAKQPAGSSGGS